MILFDLLATTPAILVGIVTCVWLIRDGDKPIPNQRRFFGLAFLTVGGLVAWSSIADLFAGSAWDRWFIHLAMDYIFGSAGALVSFFVSLAHPIRRA